MWKLENTIWGLYPRRFRIDDTNKVNNRGFWQRFNELLAKEWDETIGLYLEKFADWLLDPFTILEKFLPFAEYELGTLPVLGNTIASRRRVLNMAMVLYKHKGSKKGYEICLRMIGFTSATITEHTNNFGWDSPTTLDDPNRTLDGRCRACSDYSVNLTGTGPLNPQWMDFVYNAIVFNEPINAKLRVVNYNGQPASFSITVWVNGNGDLVYNNVWDPSLVLTLDSSGNLVVSGPNSSKYSIVNGDLIFTF